MQGFQAKTVAAVRSQRVVCVVKVSELRAKAFQIGFDKDGSVFIRFPYFQHRTGILSSSEIPATGERKADVNIDFGGKVTSHRVKYSHHPDGRAHFSQDGKIFTAIKRQIHIARHAEWPYVHPVHSGIARARRRENDKRRGRSFCQSIRNRFPD